MKWLPIILVILSVVFSLTFADEDCSPDQKTIDLKQLWQCETEQRMLFWQRSLKTLSPSYPNLWDLCDGFEACYSQLSCNFSKETAKNLFGLKTLNKLSGSQWWTKPDWILKHEYNRCPSIYNSLASFRTIDVSNGLCNQQMILNVDLALDSCLDDFVYSPIQLAINRIVNIKYITIKNQNENWQYLKGVICNSLQHLDTGHCSKMLKLCRTQKSVLREEFVKTVKAGLDSHIQRNFPADNARVKKELVSTCVGDVDESKRTSFRDSKQLDGKTFSTITNDFVTSMEMLEEVGNKNDIVKRADENMTTISYENHNNSNVQYYETDESKALLEYSLQTRTFAVENNTKVEYYDPDDVSIADMILNKTWFNPHLKISEFVEYYEMPYYENRTEIVSAAQSRIEKPISAIILHCIFMRLVFTVKM